LKDALKESEYSSLIGDKELSYHHIISNKDVESMIPKYYKDDVKHQTDKHKAGKEELENYVNLPHIQNTIVRNKKHEKTKNHGEIIHAAISWNPDNLVKGPKAELRSSDLRSNTDTELCRLKTEHIKRQLKQLLPIFLVQN
jgi:hypothetical protein